MTGAQRRVLWCLTQREGWTPEQFEVLISHPDVEVRKALAVSVRLDPERRGRLVEDPDRKVLHELIEHGMPLPLWAYERLFERYPAYRYYVADDPRVPAPVLHHFRLSEPDPQPDALPPLSRAEAERLAGHPSESTRAEAAADPRLPADLVEQLAGDPANAVRLAVSMRPELTEQQRARIDYQVHSSDRVPLVRWARETQDPSEQRRCVTSAHAGLRRSVALNPHLSPELMAALAADDDEDVRLLLVESQKAAPPETVLWVYARNLAITHSWLPDHPALAGYPFARLAEDPFPRLRALVTRDPATPPEVIERLSHDPDPAVRTEMARDRRLPVARVLELFEDHSTTEGAAANPRLPLPVMHSIVAAR
ncbi:hypothetical protein [Actinoplanes sp. URMC 104]|uniref:hypothetical protein n=1 Tax=Actinoplanes sp. URMC 104 TaxID=3423409 RepID=UPI003F1E084D